MMNDQRWYQKLSNNIWCNSGEEAEGLLLTLSKIKKEGC